MTSAGPLDIDHVVPLSEAWARSNRCKSHQHPAQWLPPMGSQDVQYRYGAEWGATKLRWNLSVDESERDRLPDIEADCGRMQVEFAPAS
ncbi:hypothetical protein [Streptomyces sp. cmx-4-9]|uniref:hypothetical protein n=1 Tax=Streptomyces sp. cmx-4-9 TaxID=2790941 RepID=UPI00397F365F